MGGEAVGSAVVDLLYGEKNPSGKLAETFPLRLEDNPSYLYYFGEGDLTEYREGIFVGYRYYDKKDMEVLFPFGYGLSYTEFAYSSLRLDRDSLKDTDSLHVSVKVENIGNRAVSYTHLDVYKRQSQERACKYNRRAFDECGIYHGRRKRTGHSV